MKKILAIAGIFFLFTTNALAVYDPSATWKTYDVGSGASNSVFGNTSTRLGLSTALTATTTIYVATTTLVMYKTGSPSDSVEGVLWSSCSTPTVLATTTAIAGSSISTSATVYTFVFPLTRIASGSSYWFGVRRTGSADASNYYRVRRGASGAVWQYVGTCSENLGGGDVGGSVAVYGELASSSPSSLTVVGIPTQTGGAFLPFTVGALLVGLTMYLWRGNH